MSYATRIKWVWLFLIVATLVSWELGHDVGFSDHRYASVTIILVSLVKVRFVLRDFMEVRHAPRALKLLTDGWIVALAAILIGLYLRVT